jgi:hypothetical protein
MTRIIEEKQNLFLLGLPRKACSFTKMLCLKGTSVATLHPTFKSAVIFFAVNIE